MKTDLPMFKGRRQHMSVEQIVSKIREAAERPLEQATTLPAEAYSSDAWFEWEVENILRKDWMCVAHRSQIPEPGDFINVEMFGEPLIVVHGKEGAIRTLTRICPHRAMDIMPPGFGAPGAGPADKRECTADGGNTRLFMCPYHAWTFELDGSLKGSPEMHKAEGFCREANGLKNFRTETWNGFVFVNFDGNAEPLSEHLAEMKETLGNWGGLDEMDMIVEMSWECDFNWKVLFENFSECYHHIGAHAKTLQPMMPAKECWTEQENRAFIHEHLPLRQSAADELRQLIADGVEFPLLPGLDHRRTHEWQLYMIPPCFMLFAGPNQAVWYRMEPLTTDRCRLLTTILAPSEYRDLPQYEACHASAKKAMVDFHMEDLAVCHAVQRGYYGAGCEPGRMSHLEMPIWLFHRYLAARTRGTRPTLDRPAAASQFGRVGPVPA